MTNKNDFLTFDELSSAIENDKGENNLKICAALLLSAINDWPTLNLKEPKHFVAELNREIKGKLTHGNLHKYLEALNPTNEAWKMESISYLLEIFDLYQKDKYEQALELETIINGLTVHYR